MHRRIALDFLGVSAYIPFGMNICSLSPLKGRPREFDLDDALAAALRVFWRNGYEAASMAELTAAMGITKPSLYAAFGNKEALFHKALDLYEREKLAYMTLRAGSADRARRGRAAAARRAGRCRRAAAIPRAAWA